MKACIGCGCTEFEPCVTTSGPCSWVPLPDGTVSRTPVCTACVETGELGGGLVDDDEGDPGAYDELDEDLAP